jgi:hypothetical protein
MDDLNTRHTKLTHESEISTRVNLCDESGNLNPGAVGFTRNPLHICNLSGHPFRKKSWNYWCVTSPDYLFSITVSNIDYLGMVFAYFLDLKSREFIEQTVMTPFGSGCKMTDTVYGRTVFHNDRMTVELDDNVSEVKLHIISPDFGKEQMEASFQIQRPEDHESLSVVIPWSNDRFQFTSKHTCLPASGELRIGNRSLSFDNDNSYACLDFGRGVWKYQSAWNWASFAGKSGKHTIGVNLGGKWTDGTGNTENGLILDGKLIKIGSDMVFEYDTEDYMKPWLIRTKDNSAVKLTFTPLYERVAKTDLGILRSEVHQMIGHFNGELLDEAGQIYEVRDLVGWAEDHAARW